MLASQRADANAPARFDSSTALEILVPAIDLMLAQGLPSFERVAAAITLILGGFSFRSKKRTSQRVGGGENIWINARVICATTRDLEQTVQSGASRNDLLYRVNLFAIECRRCAI